MKYPNDYVDDDGWWRIHKGHGLDAAALESDLERNHGRSFVPAVLRTEEVHLRLIPRLMWCGDYGGCDLEGEWHSHWVGVRPSEASRFTLAQWRLQPPQRAERPSPVSDAAVGVIPSTPPVRGCVGSGGVCNTNERNEQ